MNEIDTYFDHDYPYGDLHELNLDWIIDVAKKAADTETGLDVRVSSLEERADTVDGEIVAINDELLGVGNNIAGLEASIAESFSENDTYAVGDRVMHDCHLYQCVIAVETPGEWVGENWELVSVDDLVADLSESKQDVLTFDQTPTEDSTNPVTSGGVFAENEKLSGSIAPPYSDQETYTVGDSVMYNNELRVCAQAVTTPEEFDETKWGYNRVMDSVQALRGQIGITDGRVTSLENWTSVSTKTVTGNPITINDGSALPAKDVKVTFEPKQDLHGYDKPWAGGAGKNKLPLVLADIKAANTSGTWSGNIYTLNNVTFTVNTDSDGNVTGIKVNGTASADSIFKLAIMPIKADTSYVMNGCPQTGSQSTYVLYVDGKPTSYFDYGNGVTWASSGSDTNYDIRIFVANGYNAQNMIFYPMIRLATETDPTFEPYSNECPIEGYTDCEVEVTDGTNTNTYTIDLDGTRYGGTVDLVSGEMTVTHGIETFDGSSDEGWVYYSVDYTRIRTNALNGIMSDEASSSDNKNVISNEFPTKSNAETYAGNIGVSAGEGILFVADGSSEMSKESFTTFLANNPLQVCYELATPFTVQLTPEQIDLLKGNNTITANGTTITLEYLPNTLLSDAEIESRKYTDEKITTVLPTTPSTDGTYVLICTVDDGEASLSWVAQS